MCNTLNSVFAVNMKLLFFLSKKFCFWKNILIDSIELDELYLQAKYYGYVVSIFNDFVAKF